MLSFGLYDEFKTFFHGHSYTANQVGASAALASLELLQDKKSVHARQNLEKNLSNELQSLWQLPVVGRYIRQVGLIVGIELVKDWRTRRPFDLRERAGIRVCEAMSARGVLTRSIGNVIVLIAPLLHHTRATEKDHRRHSRKHRQNFQKLAWHYSSLFWQIRDSI